jgi:hypothetical protein
MVFCAVISVFGAVVTQTCITPKEELTARLLDVEDAEGEDDNDSIVQ